MSKNDRFHFPRKQRAGVIFLVFIITAGVLSWRIIRTIRTPVVPFTAPGPAIALKKQQQELSSSATSTKEPPPGSARQTYSQKPGPFDPNTASEEQLIAAGLPIRTARTLIKYRAKGGRFYKKEDLLKLYTMDREDYKRIERYIHIATTRQSRRDFAPGRERPDIPAVIELNQTDAATLILLKGIGPGYAKRILDYREKLGGFIRVEQLSEVYGFPDSTYRQLKQKFTVNPANIKKLNINTAGEEELSRHPYIRRYLAANIIKLRNDLKKFSKIEELRQVPLINEEKYRKIAPYLSVD